LKKLKVIFACILLTLLLAGSILFVGYFSKPSKDAKVVATIFPIYDICRELLGDEKDIVFLQDNGIDIHSYQATANDIKSISQAELFIRIGGDSDVWVKDIIKSAANANLEVLSLMDCVEKMIVSKDNIMEDGHEHHEGDGHKHNFDEHIWLSIKNMQKMTVAIQEKLIDVYPNKVELINQNTENYLQQLHALDEEYATAIAGKDKVIVVADRFPFVYLARDYNLNYLAAFAGCSADVDASAETIAKLINKINSLDLNYVCKLESSNSSIAEKIINDASTKSGVEILTINSCQSVASHDIESLSYIKIMKENLEVFKRALK